MRWTPVSVFICATVLTMIAANPLSSCLAGDSEGVSVRVAAVSFVPKKFDLQRNADRLEQAFRRAAAGDAKIAVAPEGALDGYVVNEIIAGHVSAERMNEVATTIDGEIIQRFRRLAGELEMCLVFGFAEKIQADVFNCAVFIDQQGRICGRQHKMQFAEGYDPAWWFNRLGSSSRAFDTPYGRCGILICNDRWNPQLARIPVLDGAQFLMIPSFGSRSASQDEAVLSRGRENNVPVVEANVGVTLVVNDGRIAAVDRLEDGITFGTITIPLKTAARVELRDQVEQEFLKQRVVEMEQRLKRTLEKNRTRAVDALIRLGAKTRVDDQDHVVEVNLQETKTTDADLVNLAALADLRELSLHRTQLTSAGLARLSGLTKLEQLFLSDTQTDDRGLTALSSLRDLKVLGLSGTRVTDQGLQHLKELRHLESLFLIGTGVTVDGVNQLRKDLPGCNIVH